MSRGTQQFTKRVCTGIKHRLKVAREAAQDAGKIKDMKDLAKRSKIPNSRIYKWENGDHEPPLASITELAKPLDVDAGWLAVGEYTRAPISEDEGLARAIASTLALRLQAEASESAADIQAAGKAFDDAVGKEEAG